ncbi:hypothetical protein AVEN_151228-1 [Araneus ventricosus]|uniref:Uncharacterized protein n=1 Tax=Araneus ventricosus TaxID=182803 RepID=A0A4Y2FXT5_ARAVE|nr:hypothetical protein AVEN_226337-1 [Araneus ventricosus]GBM45951.1 hypothetical protein AVEN_151228-1 [Araneus ventricosus]
MPSRITLATPYWIEKVCTKRSLSPSPNDKGKPAPVATDKRAGEIGNDIFSEYDVFCHLQPNFSLAVFNGVNPDILKIPDTSPDMSLKSGRVVTELIGL